MLVRLRRNYSKNIKNSQKHGIIQKEFGQKGLYEKNELKRKNIRLKQYDYTRVGYYFITFCTKNRECILSKIKSINDIFITELTLEGNIVNNWITSN